MDSELIQDALRRYLGRELYDACMTLYDRVKNRRGRYKIIMSDRCAVLMRLLCAIAGDSYEDMFYTRDSAMAAVPQIAEKYTNFGAMPLMVFVEDIVTDGRHIDKFFDEFTRSICESLRDSGISFTWRNVIDDVRAYLNIEAITVYWDRLQDNLGHSIRRCYNIVKNFAGQDSFFYYPKADRHLFDFRLSNVLFWFAFPLQSSLPYFTVPYGDSETWNRLHARLDSRMIPSPLNGTCLVDIWLCPVSDRSNNVKAALIVQSRSNRLDGSKTFMASVVGPNGAQVGAVLGKVKNAEFQRMYAGMRSFSPDVGIAVICADVLKDLCRECGAGPVQYDKAQYRGCADPFGLSEREDPWFDLSDAKQILLDASQDAEPLFRCRNQGGDVVDCVKTVKETLADVICDMAYEEAKYLREQVLHRYYRAKMSMTVQEVAAEVQSRISSSGDVGVDGYSFMVSFMTALVMLQNISVVTVDGNVLRPGRMGLYYMPDRYFQHFYTMELLERKRQFDEFTFKGAVRRWYYDRIDHAELEQMIAVIEKIYEAGYKLSDWRTDVNEWVKDEDIRCGNCGFVPPDEVRKQYVNTNMRRWLVEQKETDEYLDAERMRNKR